MKKILSILILIVLLFSLTITVNASSADDLADTLYNMGSPYGMTSADKVRIERYLSDNDVTDEQADEIISIAEQAVAIMEEAGATGYSDLTTTQKNELKSLANEAADILGLTLTFSKGRVDIYQSGVLIESVTLENDKLVYTGSNINIVLVVSSIAVLVIALVAGYTARKKFANA